MTGKLLLAALVVLSCVTGSWQRCFSYHCPHHAPLAQCLQGTWQCQADEFCEVQTHVSHGNSPWVISNCRPAHNVPDCWGSQAQNDPNCDPNKHDRMCHWCCVDRQCVEDLTQGIFPTASAAPATTPTTATMSTTGSSAATGSTTVVDTTVTQPGSTAQPCEDLYLGDCSHDYGGRCAEPLIAQLCARSCNLC